MGIRDVARARGILLGAVLLAIAGPATAAEPDARDTADFTVGLPSGGEPDVTVSLEEGHVLLDLPAKATYPSDFSAGSGGLVAGAEVTRGAADRVLLSLELADGLLSGISYGPRSVTLRFRRGHVLMGPGSSPSATGQYVLGAEDKLRISVNGAEEFTQESVVSHVGSVSAPLVGEISAAGLTVDAFTSRLTELLARDYLVSPKVDVQVLEYRSQWVMVTGEVKHAGRVFLRGTSTLKDVLAEAEGYTPEAGESVTISRQGPTQESIVVDRGAFERGEANPTVRHGDIVTVEPTAYCFVNGEVRNPGNVRITRGMTLLRAISMAGGLTEWANRKEIQLSEKGSDSPRVFNVKQLESSPDLDPPLKGGELIFVKRRFL